jgi:2'-5' RNA ligase
LIHNERVRGEAVETAVLLCVPEADELVGAWREKGDPAAAAGVPAHVTLLYPFLDSGRIDAGVLAELAWFFTGVDAFPVRFDDVAEFTESGVLYLDPQGRELDELAAALARRWPECPPYGGAVDAPHAHLTVVHTPDEALRAQAAEAVRPELPLAATAGRAALWRCDEHGRWSEAHVFDLGQVERPD